MIWITFGILMIIEIIVHAIIINRGTDPTPDGKRGGSNTVIYVRFLYVWANYLFFNQAPWRSDGDWLLFTLYILGVLFTHLLVFPVMLNLFTGKTAHHLGKGFTDKQLAKLPPIARWFWLLCLSAGMIYGYFHPELL